MVLDMNVEEPVSAPNRFGEDREQAFLEECGDRHISGRVCSDVIPMSLSLSTLAFLWSPWCQCIGDSVHANIPSLTANQCTQKTN